MAVIYRRMSDFTEGVAEAMSPPDLVQRKTTGSANTEVLLR